MVRCRFLTKLALFFAHLKKMLYLCTLFRLCLFPTVARQSPDGRPTADRQQADKKPKAGRQQCVLFAYYENTRAIGEKNYDY